MNLEGVLVGAAITGASIWGRARVGGSLLVHDYEKSRDVHYIETAAPDHDFQNWIMHGAFPLVIGIIGVAGGLISHDPFISSTAWTVGLGHLGEVGYRIGQIVKAHRENVAGLHKNDN